MAIPPEALLIALCGSGNWGVETNRCFLQYCRLLCWMLKAGMPLRKALYQAKLLSQHNMRRAAECENDP